MSNETGQSEDLNAGNGSQVEENGDLNAEGSANTGNEDGHEGENGEQGQQQSKSRSAKARLRRKLQESEARQAKLEEELRQKDERLTSLEQKVDGVINPPQPRPSRVNFESEEEYEDAVYEWRQKENKRQQQQGKEGSTEQPPATESKPAESPAGQPTVNQDVVDNWMDRCDAAAEKYDDFDEVLNNESLMVSMAMRDAMMESESGAEIAYHLGKNPKEAERIGKLSVIGQIREIDKLASKFAPSTTKAPSPIETPKGDDAGTGIDVEKMSPDQYRLYRREQRANRRK